LTVSLSGTGTAPIAGVAPAALTYASQPAGTTSAPQSVTVSNTGTGPLTVGIPAITGSFAISANTCTVDVAAGGACSISVTFTPAATAVAGTLTGTLSIPNSSATTPLTVSLSGTVAPGPAPVANVAPASLIYPSTVLNTTSAAQVVTVSNT